MNPPSAIRHPQFPLSRRDMLRTTVNGFGYLALAGLAAEAAAKQTSPMAPKPAHFPATAKRVIFLFMQGGPSHLDTFDYKPKLQADDGKPFNNSKIFGSPWKFAQHGQCGQWVSELFPCVAQHVDELCMLTGMATEGQAHGPASLFMHTGHTQQVRPSLGSWTLYGLGSESSELPGFIAMNPMKLAGQFHGSAFLPASYQATFIQPLPPKGEQPVPNLAPHLTADQQRVQLELMRRVNAGRLALDEVNSEMEGLIQSYELAFRMQSAVPSLMDLSSESPATLSMYGIDKKETEEFGRQCLLARRFAESGVRFIEIGTGKWDHHVDLQELHPKSAREVDQPIAALLTDLKQRGLLNDTLVVWGGEFGRTPFAQSGNGRDHNNRGFTMWAAGGGMKAGIRHGITDEYGREAVEQRVHVHDLHATILHCLGLDHEKLTYRYSGRDFRLTDVKGNVVKEILG
jgi:hypothetical protein